MKRIVILIIVLVIILIGGYFIFNKNMAVEDAGMLKEEMPDQVDTEGEDLVIKEAEESSQPKHINEYALEAQPSSSRDLSPYNYESKRLEYAGYGYDFPEKEVRLVYYDSNGQRTVIEENIAQQTVDLDESLWYPKVGGFYLVEIFSLAGVDNGKIYLKPQKIDLTSAAEFYSPKGIYEYDIATGKFEELYSSNLGGVYITDDKTKASIYLGLNEQYEGYDRIENPGVPEILVVMDFRTGEQRIIETLSPEQTFIAGVGDVAEVSIALTQWLDNNTLQYSIYHSVSPIEAYAHGALTPNPKDDPPLIETKTVTF